VTVETISGNWYDGVNIENVNFSLTIHGEQAAIIAAYLGENPEDRKFIKSVIIDTRDGGMPCGGCRQFIAEFATDDCVVACNGDVHKFWDLLPHPFTPASLGL